jgi:hypothetical protein
LRRTKEYKGYSPLRPTAGRQRREAQPSTEFLAICGESQRPAGESTRAGIYSIHRVLLRPPTNDFARFLPQGAGFSLP